MFYSYQVVFTFCCFFTLIFAADHSFPSIVSLQTSIGRFDGVISDNSPSTASFLGIPYCKPPIGERRWKVPEPNDEIFTADAYFNATHRGAKCPQGESVMGSAGMKSAEDCLFLNIHVPLTALDLKNQRILDNLQQLNVMIFIHGGAFALGSGMDPYISPEEYAKRNIILVTMNYRMGILGFLSLEEIHQEDPMASNFGLLDQRLSMIWVQKYIQHFGGDPKQITIFGESAGAISVLLHLTTTQDSLPKSQQLQLKGAIIQSAPNLESVPCSEVYQLKTYLQSASGCQQSGPEFLECLRSIDANQIITLLPDFGKVRKIFWHTYTEGSGLFAPCIDNGLFSKNFRNILDSDSLNKNVNLMVGTTKDEGTMFTFFTFLFHSDLSKDMMENMIATSFFDHDDDDDATKIFLKYFNNQTRTPYDSLSELTNDVYFQCAADHYAKAFSKYQKNVYKYLFDHLPEHGIQRIGVFHASELAFMFNTAMGGYLFPSKLNEKEQQLAQTMVNYWVNFALYGNPSPDGSDVPKWPSFSSSHPNTQVLSLNITTVENYKGEICSFWHSLYPNGVPFKGLADEMLHEDFYSFVINTAGFSLIRRRRQVIGGVVVILVIVLVFFLRCCLSRSSQKEKTD